MYVKNVSPVNNGQDKMLNLTHSWRRHLPSMSFFNFINYFQNYQLVHKNYEYLYSSTKRHHLNTRIRFVQSIMVKTKCLPWHLLWCQNVPSMSVFNVIKYSQNFHLLHKNHNLCSTTKRHRSNTWKNQFGQWWSRKVLSFSASTPNIFWALR